MLTASLLLLLLLLLLWLWEAQQSGCMRPN
jgi:hypothetical protein